MFKLLPGMAVILVATPITAASEPLGPSSHRTGVVISEILAFPSPPTETRFVELYNSNLTPVDLNGWQISGSLSHTFTNATVLALGAFLVVASDAAQLRSRYGLTNVVGGLTAAAPSAKFRLRLHNRWGAVLLETVVDDSPLWPATFKNGGHSLVLCRPSYGEADPRAWSASAQRGGSPGRPEPVPSPHPLPTPFASAPLPGAQVVINEVMYHPPDGDDESQFVELFNRSDRPVDLSGWRLRGGVTFEFGAGKIIPPGGFVVIARNPGRLLQYHPEQSPASVLGAFKGRLGHRGDYLALVRPAGGGESVVDEVRWYDGGRWGRWSDGGGSSLELRDPRSDRRSPDSWADSDESAKSSWTTVEFTGALIQGDGSGSRRLELLFCGPGECLVDDVEVLFQGTNLVSAINSGLNEGLGDWKAQGNHENSRWQKDGGTANSPCLLVSASGRGDYFFNRLRVDLLQTIPAGATATLRARARWLRGSPDLLLRLTGNFLEASARLPIPGHLGSPGRANSMAVTNLGPTIDAVAHFPVLPADHQRLLVSARLSDPDGITSAWVQYRIDGVPGGHTAALADDGTGGDVRAGDGVYSATLPGAAAGKLLAFRVFAVDACLATNCFPPLRPAFPGDKYGRECLVRFGEPQPPLGEQRFFSYHLWLTSAALEHWSRRGSAHNGPVPATLVYQNHRIIYEASVRYSGSFNTRAATFSPLDSLSRSPLAGYNVTLPADEPILGTDELVLDANSRPGFAQHEQLALWVAGELGLPACHRRYVHIFLNGVPRSLFEDVQQPGRDMLKSWFPNGPEPELYKLEVWWQATNFPQRGSYHAEPPLAPYRRDGGFNLARYRWTLQKRAARGSMHDYTNVFSLVEALNAPASNYPAAVVREVNVEQWMRVLAFQRIVGNHDSWGRHAPHNYYLVKPQQAGWQLIPFDLDYAFFGGEDPRSDLVEKAFYSDPLLDRLVHHPPFLRAYLRALLDALNGPLFRDSKTGKLARADAFMDAHYQAISRINELGDAELSPDYLAPGWQWSLRGWFAKRHDAILATLQRFGRPAFSARWVPASPDVALEGDAPVEVAGIRANDALLNLEWTTVTQWRARLPGTLRGKAIILQGLDQLGQAIPGAQVILPAAQ